MDGEDEVLDNIIEMQYLAQQYFDEMIPKFTFWRLNHSHMATWIARYIVVLLICIWVLRFASEPNEEEVGMSWRMKLMTLLFLV